uniref:Uncharacterized protein n=1 Tax=Photinus pyralis TaxID=7054 RepID=A0A1Y1KI81_PHOPY
MQIQEKTLKTIYDYDIDDKICKSAEEVLLFAFVVYSKKIVETCSDFGLIALLLSIRRTCLKINPSPKKNADHYCYCLSIDRNQHKTITCGLRWVPIKNSNFLSIHAVSFKPPFLTEFYL